MGLQIYGGLKLHKSPECYGPGHYYSHYVTKNQKLNLTH